MFRFFALSSVLREVLKWFHEEHPVANHRCLPDVSTDASDTFALPRQVYVDVPVPMDQPFEQLVHSTRDVHVPVPASGPGRAHNRGSTDVRVSPIEAAPILGS